MAWPPLTYEQFQARLPEFASTPTDTITNYINEAQPFFDTVRWDDLLFLGVVFWVAHYITLDAANANSQLTDDSVMKKVGDISKSRSAKLVELEADDDFYRTNYGGRYLKLKYLVSRGGMAV
jgi:hypothetical protein